MSYRKHLDAISVEEGLRPWYAPDHDYAAQAVLDLPDGTCRIVGLSASAEAVGPGLADLWREHIQRVKSECAE